MKLRINGRRALPALAGIATLALLGACASSAEPNISAAPSASVEAKQVELTVTDNYGDVKLLSNPENVIVLSNLSMQTLFDWGITPVALPKGVMGSVWPTWIDDANIPDIGNHREPNLEVIVAAKPDLVIGGYRFGSYYEDIKKLVPETPVIEVTPRDGEDFISELKRGTDVLGKIFSKETEATALNDRLDAAVASAKEAYAGETVIGLITSDKKISYASPKEGRGISQLFQTLDLVPALDTAGTSNHQGDEISVEAIAAANPEWLIVLDRDGAFQEDGYLSAKELIEGSEALQNVPAVQKGQIVYLDKNFYLTEGIEAYTALYEQLAAAFAAAK